MPRRRVTGAPAAPSAAEPSLLSLPEALLVECLQYLRQSQRLQHVALVNKQLRSLCLAPPLLQELRVTIRSEHGGAVVRRTRALLGLLTVHARHVRTLTLDVRLPTGVLDAQRLETAALVTGCMVACGAAGGELERLLISRDTPLASTAWLPALTSLQGLDSLGSTDQQLHLDAGVSKLTALRIANLLGSSIGGGCLPASLTNLRLEGIQAGDPLPTVGNLSSLRYLSLSGCEVPEDSLQQLAALPLRDLDVYNTTLPPCLSQLTRLTTLAVSGYNDDELLVLDAALACLSQLRRLALAPDPHTDECRLPSGVTALRSLQRFCLHRAFEATVVQQPLPGGAWLASLQWLGLPYRMAAAAAAEGVLDSAAQLEYFGCSGWPEREAGQAEQEGAAAWDAFWGFLQRHPPLRCVAVDTDSVPGSAASPNAAAVDALLDLWTWRPELQLRRTPRPASLLLQLLSLPDALLVECLRHVSQEERLQHVALVNKRLSSLCLAPQLLQTLEVSIDSDSGSAAVVRRAQSLLGLFTAHGSHVRHLELDVELPEEASEKEVGEVAALVTGCLAACAAAGGGPETLWITANTPLASTAWLPGLTRLQKLEGLGNVDDELRLPGLGKLTALHSASIYGKTIRLGGALPPSLTHLLLEGSGAQDTMPPVANLTGLQSLSLYDCAFAEDSMRQLSALALQHLALLDRTTIPPCLSALGQLTCLAVNICSNNDMAVMDTALAGLHNLRRLALSVHGTATARLLPPAITSLRKLERLCMYSGVAEVAEGALPGGAWLASVQWLCVPYRMVADAADAGVLSSAAQLEYFCCSGWPQQAAGQADDGNDATWEAFWHFLASLPALRCFAIDTYDVHGSEAAPSTAAVDAMLDLQCRRPGLQLRRLPRTNDDRSFWDDVFDCDDIPEGAGA